MTSENRSAVVQIESIQYIDMTQNARLLGFDADFNIYVTHFVWETYIVWSAEDDQFFNVHQTQHERQNQILKDAINLLSSGKEKIPEKELFFNRYILVRKIRITELELTLFKINSARNEQDEICLIIDAVKIT
ncbi:MAG: hypothetical protein KZQ64_08095 [gamma proteobacterium symbiont of Bathyaustriella thionipta]|nr:hypothetical protein [gamma proteobacterium symbiont of Bathyaustriella thionipta]MCU7950571.1 hypothetical protein [gamma proteobacterium symbiont of Bathyaustriella thionipta]MCU7953334.1 hypothetical protein [gamma proteobacterium symbiont of Bathyaustriella thionipta]MCU7957080.1 hypothetical protein [gamma proteobacterium symbiont of Bathyaustriella thionipta]MCU7967989.1 hypothetical protein [gamma proteobacterium symbiont of Bathyaustriella thionipta]